MLAIYVTLHNSNAFVKLCIKNEETSNQSFQENKEGKSDFFPYSSKHYLRSMISDTPD